MSGFDKVIPFAAAAALLFAASSRLTGQVPVENGRSFPLAASAEALPETLDRVDAMLSAGELDIAAVQGDTMIRGRAVERLAQVYEGLPVFGAQVVRQMDGRSVISVTGRLYDALDMNVAPSISSQRANEIAMGAAPPGAQISGETTLGIVPVEGGYRLAYRMLVRSDWTIREVYVDAHSGAIVRSINGIHSQAAIGQGNGVFGASKKLSTHQASGTFQAVDKLRPAEAFTLLFPGTVSRLNLFLNTGAIFNSDVATDSDNTWSDGPTVDAHVYQGWVYDYYFKRFGRSGMDDSNVEVDSIVHPLARSEANRQPPDVVGTFINNAFYCCDGLLVFGDGDGRVFTFLAGGFDVVAHEWTHGVTDFTSRLIYQDESGALNEAFSDIMAAAMEFYYQPPGGGRDEADWLIAEDVVLLSPGFLRSLNNPIAGGEPDHYTLRQFIGTTIDDGGVHYNPTIATHAFYLSVVGGRNRVSGITVPGVGMTNIERMEWVFYRAFTMLMGPNSRFSDARRATIQAAADLFGEGSAERTQVELAWTAVGVN
ncbi:MAG: peptidase M4 family protein [Acidobacteria bacterium]|nr:MAG: peptidase M4 family protein [Acidobacteriota bacterium]